MKRFSMRWSGHDGDLAMHEDTTGQWCDYSEVRGLEREIERLTDRNDVLASDLALMEAERDRLRAALEQIIKEYSPAYDTWDFVGIAKNALAGAPDEPNDH